jgi:energy-coupling factor transport system ATP-binding protein
MKLVADNLQYAWPGQSGSECALDHISAEFNPGTIHLICGPSGSGKSTLSLMLAGLIKPDSGIISLNGLPLETRRHRIACTFQFPENIFFEDSVQDELNHWCMGDHQPDTAFFDLLGIDFASIAQKHPFHLSAGFGRMTGIALQLSRQPDVLILDEPTTGLDWIFHGRLIRVLREWISPDRILIVVTHDLGVMAELGGMSWVMERGRLGWFGATAQLLADPHLLEQYGLQ